MNLTLRLRVVTTLSATLEFYDFTLLIFLASTISLNFFPAASGIGNIMPVLMIFFAGYLARFIGGLIYSHGGDKHGRKPYYMNSMILMSLSTLGIALIPGHDTIGNMAPLLLLFFRLLQGASLGGEVPGSVVYASEYSRENKRGLVTGLIVSGLTFGNILASGAVWFIHAWFGEQAVNEWAWRIPFALGSVIGLISLWLRHSLAETPVFESFDHSRRETIPVISLMKGYRSQLLSCLLVTNPILVYPFPRQTKIMIPLPPQHWSEQIFGCANLGDKRRTKRLVKVAGDLSAHTGSSLATSCSGNLAAVEGAYRLIENEAVEPDAIAEAGFQATAVAANDYQLILAIEDSTTLSYKHSVRSELGDIGGPENSISKGIWAHSVMLLDVDSERTIGLIDQQRWIRNDDDRGKKHERKQRPYEDKESFKWQKSSENIEHRLGVQISKVISVCDREADVYEYIRFQLTHGRRFVVRATQNRILIDDERLLFDALSAEPVLGKYTVDVPQRGGRKARKATLQVKKKTVTIQSPQRPGGRLEPITVNILVAEEISNGTEDRLCWILLTSEPIETFECCRKILRFYELRWRIEEFHKAWKTGAGVERLRLLCADNLQRLAVILMFVAVRLLQIREALMLPYKRQKKDDNTWNENTLADCVVGDEEWKVLWLTYYEGKPLPDAVPTLSWLLHTVAKVGGWCDSKRTGIPGWLVVWKGWAKLQDRLHTYRMTRGVEM